MFQSRGVVKNQPEDNQKLVDGNQKQLTEVKMAEGHLTKYQNYCMYISEPAELVTFSENP